MKTCFIGLLLPALASSFVVRPGHATAGGFATILFSAVDDDAMYQGYADQWMEQQEQERQKHSKEPAIPTFEADYLAAAKARAAGKISSANSQAKDEDWQQIMEEKKNQYGIQNIGSADEWEDAARNAEKGGRRRFWLLRCRNTQSFQPISETGATST